MTGDSKTDRGAWSRRDVLSIGGLAAAAGVIGSTAGADASTPAQSGGVPVPAVPGKGPQVYTRIGVRPFINLTGTLTINGGALTLAEVREASHEAADHAVDIDELMEKAGARIAELMGCEAAIVTSGAAAALSHATAACIAGTDPELMQQLPDLTGLKNEIIMPRAVPQRVRPRVPELGHDDRRSRFGAGAARRARTAHGDVRGARVG